MIQRISIALITPLFLHLFMKDTTQKLAPLHKFARSNGQCSLLSTAYYIQCHCNLSFGTQKKIIALFSALIDRKCFPFSWKGNNSCYMEIFKLFLLYNYCNSRSVTYQSSQICSSLSENFLTKQDRLEPVKGGKSALQRVVANQA